MRRRDFITLLGGTAAVWPLAARAQQAAVPTIGVLITTTLGPFADRLAAFHRGLKEGGFVEGANLAVEYRWGESHDDRLPALAADLVRRKVKVIAGLDNTAAVLAAKAATTTIPIVFNIGADPVRNRLVESLGHPGGNVTGVSSMDNALGPKRLGLLHDLLPKASTVAVLINPNNPNAEPDVKALQAAAPSIGVTLEVFSARNEREIDAFFANLAREHIPAFITSPESLFNARREQIAALATYNAIAGMSVDRIYADAGWLVSYGSDHPDDWRRAGVYVSRVLKGEKPADLPVLQPTKFQLVINLKTARKSAYGPERSTWSTIPDFRCWGRSGNPTLAPRFTALKPRS
jgi:putative ABC transport system substrate-binding protein